MTDDNILAAALEVLQRRAGGETAQRMTVAELYAKFEAAHRKAKSWAVGERKLRSIVAAFGTRDVMSLAVLDWSDYAQKRRETPVPQGKGRCYCERSINQELGWFKTMFYWAAREGRIRYNPIALARHTKIRRGRETAPVEVEVAMALTACQTPGQRVMVLCGADAGMRRGEILQLRHDWVDHDAGRIRLPNWACKNSKGGTIPATRRLLEAIAAVPRHIRCPNVLVSPETGGAYHRNTLDEWWKGIRERAGLQGAPLDGEVRLHDLRHGCATNAVGRGVRIEIVSRRILRHSSLAQTEVYVQNSEGDLDGAVEKFEAGIERDMRRGPHRAKDSSDCVNTEQTSGLPNGYAGTSTGRLR